MVSVRVLTFNQEQWIRQTLDSILAQRISYTFEVVIGEDCGSDGTRKICEEYAAKYENVFLVPQVKNLGLIGNWANVNHHVSGKYIMGCAGDDYWHNPDKMQMQVDYMEAHPECVMCHTDIDELHQTTGALVRNVKQTNGIVPPEGKIQKEILAGKERVSAVTMCVRREVFEKYVPYDEFAKRRFPREDWPTLLILAAQQHDPGAWRDTVSAGFDCNL